MQILSNARLQASLVKVTYYETPDRKTLSFLDNLARIYNAKVTTKNGMFLVKLPSSGDALGFIHDVNHGRFSDYVFAE